MSTSTDAIVAYGYALGDDLGGAEISDEAWDADPGGGLETRLVDAGVTGVEVLWHCSDASPMYFLAAKGSDQRAYRGSPEPLRDVSVNTAKWDEDLARAVEVLGLKVDGKPRWTVMSWWG